MGASPRRTRTVSAEAAPDAVAAPAAVDRGCGGIADDEERGLGPCGGTTSARPASLVPTTRMLGDRCGLTTRWSRSWLAVGIRDGLRHSHDMNNVKARLRSWRTAEGRWVKSRTRGAGLARSWNRPSHPSPGASISEASVHSVPGAAPQRRRRSPAPPLPPAAPPAPVPRPVRRRCEPGGSRRARRRRGIGATPRGPRPSDPRARASGP